METIKPNKDNYDFVAECRHVTNATNEKSYYFAIPRTEQHAMFTRWNGVNPLFDVDQKLCSGSTVSEETADMNLFAIVEGPYIYGLQGNTMSVVKVNKILRADHSPVSPTKSIIGVVDFASQYERDMTKKRINTITATMRNKKNIFVKDQLLHYLCEYDAEVKDLLDEYKKLTNHDFKF